MTGNRARIAFALLAAAYLLPLSALLGFRLLTLQMLMPNGWPDAAGRAWALAVGLGVFAACIVSVGIAWHLSIGYFARGRAWFAGRPRWQKLAALLGPLYVVAVAIGGVAEVSVQQQTEAWRAMPAVYRESMWRTAWGFLAASLLFLPPALMMAWPRRAAEG